MRYYITNTNRHKKAPAKTSRGESVICNLHKEKENLVSKNEATLTGWS